MYHSVEMSCRIIRKGEENINDDEYECEENRDKIEDGVDYVIKKMNRVERM